MIRAVIIEGGGFKHFTIIQTLVFGWAAVFWLACIALGN